MLTFDCICCCRFGCGNSGSRRPGLDYRGRSQAPAAQGRRGGRPAGSDPRAPKVEYIEGSKEIHSPTHLQLKFESFGGAKIDPDSVKVTYLRTPNVDLTSRVKSFVQASGIDMPDVELPVGDHMVRVDIKDSDGRVGSTSFVLKVAP